MAHDTDANNRADDESEEPLKSSNSPEVSEKPNEPTSKVPDGGYGWMVVFGSTLTHFLIVGLGRSFGIFYVVLLDMFKSSSSETSWVIAIHLTIRQVLGPVSGMLVDRFTCRVVVMAGGFLFMLACVISAFATNLVFLYVSFGVIGGIGSSLIFTPSYIIVGQYFDKRKGTAMGMSTIGSGLGSIVMAPLLSTLLSYYGYTGAMLISGALMANNIVAGGLFRPLVTKKEQEVADDVSNIGCVERLRRATSVLSNVTFVLYCLQITTMAVCLQSFLQLLPGIGEENGAELETAAFLLSVVGITDMISRFLWGFFFDLKPVRHRRRLFHAFLGVFMGASAMCAGLMTSYTGLVVTAVFFGLFEGGFHGQRATVISEFVAKDQMSSTVGFVIFFQGLGNMLGPPVAGALRDVTGSYCTSYFFCGAMLSAMSLVFLANYAMQACYKRCSTVSV